MINTNVPFIICIVRVLLSFREVCIAAFVKAKWSICLWMHAVWVCLAQTSLKTPSHDSKALQRYHMASQPGWLTDCSCHTRGVVDRSAFFCNPDLGKSGKNEEKMEEWKISISFFIFLRGEAWGNLWTWSTRKVPEWTEVWKGVGSDWNN